MPRGKRRPTPFFGFAPASRALTRRRLSRTDIRLFISVAVVLGGLWLLGLLAQLLSSPQGIDFIRAAIVAIIAVIFAAVGIFAGRLLLRGMAARKIVHAVDDAVARNMDNLVRRYAQLVTRDAYGALHTERWEKEVEYFLARHVALALGSDRQRMMLRQREGEFVGTISAHVAEAVRKSSALSYLTANATGADFEAFCAEKLRSAGWDAHVTKGARDQGVDVIATKNGIRVILQCKFHKRPIGNKAVQEAAAGRAYERAHYAAVVSATAYTRDAEQLARTTSVLLLHYSQLDELDSMLATATRAAV